MEKQAPLETPSLRTIARFARVSCQTLLRWFGSKSLLHRRVLSVMAVTWCHWLEDDLTPADCQPISPLTTEDARNRLEEFMGHPRWADGARDIDGAGVPPQVARRPHVAQMLRG